VEAVFYQRHKILLMKKAKFSADFKNLDAIRELVGDVAEQAGFSCKDIYSIQLATDEACSNIIEHAYKGIPKGMLDVSCEAAGRELTVIVHDHGKEFDMSGVRKPNLSKRLSEREVGGLGVYLMHQLMDEVHFSSSKRSGNTLTMIKRKSGDS
jgi:serine/threonine-protein kinase RsbW